MNALFRKLNRSPRYIKLVNKEYWPMWATYFFVVWYYLFLSLKARSFFFFSATNPSIETGGMLGESKKNILDKIPNTYKATSLYIEKHLPFEAVLQLMQQNEVSFPIVIKPNVGERGTLVERIETPEALQQHLQKNIIDYIIQPFIDYPEELAIMFWRMPDSTQVKISSVTLKAFLSFEGDGKTTLRELILNNPRAVLQWEKLKIRFADLLDSVIPKGEKIIGEVIGNHSRGTKFINGNHLIDSDLELAIQKIALSLEGIYFGRFDLKCKSIEALKQGKDIAILEINGVGSEPAHIYDPSISYFDIQKALFKQWTIMYKIARYNHQYHGVPYMSFKETWQFWKALQTYHSTLNQSY